MMVTIKQQLDFILALNGLDANHELYEKFDNVFRLGIMYGSTGVYQYIEDDDHNSYYVQTGADYAEDERGNRVCKEDVMRSAVKQDL